MQDEKDLLCKHLPKVTDTATLISYKTNLTSDNEKHFIMIKVSIHQEDKTIPSLCPLNKLTSKYIRKTDRNKRYINLQL